MDYEKLYNSYYMQVYSYVMTIMKDSYYAEDITQEVFYKAMKSSGKFRKDSSESTWLCAIARNTCIDILRKQKKYVQWDEMEIPNHENIEQSLIDKNTAFQIYQLLHNMEEPYQKVFQLRIFGELDFREIGNIFGKTESWARVTYHRAKLKLQERMKIDE
ncbi:MAG: RNA polymerase sigma factor [Lachnospiraceae bacterium]|nr:RNA polymerase sigma factor [Lachnospiraceae bacterium]